MAKTVKFTIEVNGLELPERVQAEISKALNQTLMHKLGELDLAPGSAKKDLAAAGNGNFTALKYLINGGILHNVASLELTNAIKQFEAKNNIPAGAGAINVILNQ
ncbi:MAG: hypothetical protein JST39_02610 [Bacteroidetes bacterium]|nr:hypothetical protein [Bacteroidota bacterium]